MLIDSHSHLNFKDFSADFDEVIARLKEAGVEKIINIGTSMADAAEVIDLARKYDWMFAAVGLHPNDSPSASHFAEASRDRSEGQATAEGIDWNEFEKLAHSPKVVAIGECGLDYSRIKAKGLRSEEDESEIDRQKKLFAKQIEIAKKLNLPLSIHIRDAQEDAMEILDPPAGGQNDGNLSGVFHCFSGEQNYLDFILQKLPNFYVSFAGNLTFKNAQPLRDLAKGVPLNLLLVETDCPFLTPEPHRGSRNEPANVKITAQTLAQIKNVNFEEIACQTTKNAEKLFHI